MTSHQITFRMSSRELDAMREAMGAECTTNTSEYIRRAVAHKIGRDRE